MTELTNEQRIEAQRQARIEAHKCFEIQLSTKEKYLVNADTLTQLKGKLNEKPELPFIDMGGVVFNRRHIVSVQKAPMEMKQGEEAMKAYMPPPPPPEPPQ